MDEHLPEIAVAVYAELTEHSNYELRPNIMALRHRLGDHRFKLYVANDLAPMIIDAFKFIESEFSGDFELDYLAPFLTKIDPKIGSIQRSELESVSRCILVKHRIGEGIYAISP